jgi:hypothetical protein
MFDNNFSVAPRQTLPVEKLMEKLLDTVFLPTGQGRACLAIDISYVRSCVTTATLSSRERKKLRQNLLTGFDESTFHVLWETLLILNQRGHPWDRLIGIRENGIFFHFSEDICRFRHVSGLADALHLSLLSLGVNVNFPEKVYKRLSSVSEALRVRAFSGKIRFKNGNLHQGYVLLNRFSTRNRRVHLIRHLLPQFPPDLPEKLYVKIIKENLVDNFCVHSEQERPTLSIRSISFFPEYTQKKLDSRFSSDRRNRIRFYKNLLESKSVCAPVGGDMIKEAYEKHHASLCRDLSEQTPVPEEFLRKLYEYGVRVGKEVEKVYDPFVSRLPNTRATVEKNRQKGGARAALSGNIEVQKGPLYLSATESHRVEPFVIGLFGPPASGKTTSVSRLCHSIGRIFYPDLKGEDLVYSRSCSTEHWDGYTGQPIVVLDDLGQDQSCRSDLVEFEQLISVNPYVLPMAHLDDKGRKFTSPFVITTSNMVFSSPLRTQELRAVIEDDRAFWRRFHLPLSCTRDARQIQFQELKLECTVSEEKHTGDHLNTEVSTLPSHWRNYNVQNHIGFGRKFSDTLALVDEILPRYRAHVDYHHTELTDTWRQNLASFSADVCQGPAPFYNVSISETKGAPFRTSDVTASILFPRYPPYHAPVVEAVAIPEPLKVRMITKAEAETKVLQPFQRALFQYLKSKPQFVLTHGVSWGTNEEFDKKLEWILRIESEIKAILGRRQVGDLWLSGDYSAATDNFPLSVTNSLVEGILSQISHEPTRAWVRYEVSPHIIRYPNGVTGTQTSGQLMGSLISFPLLCFLNDFIIRESGFEEGKYLINGDDVVALGSSEKIKTWRANAPQVGLDLSIGKNFIDPDFCCVNSQLFWKGNVEHTGKVSCQTRYGKTLSRCFSETQYYYGNSDEIRREFIRRNLIPLRSTPRSLDVPTTHGGLGLLFNPHPGFDPALAKRVFIHDWLSPFARSMAVPGYDFLRAINVPVGVFSDEEMELGGGEPEENHTMDLLSSLDFDPPDEESSELSMSSFRKREDEYRRSDENIRPINQLLACNFTSFPPLHCLRTKVVFVQKGKVGFLKKKTTHLALLALHSACLSRVRDTEEDWVEIQREVLEEGDLLDPLFSSSFEFCLDEVEPGEIERYGGAFPDLEVTIRPGFYSPGTHVPSIFDDLLRPVPPLVSDQREPVRQEILSQLQVLEVESVDFHLSSIEEEKEPLPE